MQNKLCDVTKCLTTVAAGVLSGRDRKKKLETGLLFEVLLLDQQISLGSSPFLRDTMPSRASCYVPEGTNVKKLCKWGVFPSEDVQLVKRRLCGVDGRGGCKNASTVCGELSFHRFLAKMEQRREWIVKICRKNTPRFLWTKPAKKERLTHVSQAARFLDEVEMEVDGNISREAGRLRIFRGS